MAFGGAAVFAAAGVPAAQGAFNILSFSGVTLAANAAPAPNRANADTGAFSSNTGAIDAVPANTTSMPANFSKGPDNYTQSDLDAIIVIAQDSGVTVTKLHVTKALVANVNPAPTFPVISNSNAEIIIQNLGAGAATGLDGTILEEHTSTR
jgi:hypothetical protein